MALTALHVPYSLESGLPAYIWACRPCASASNAPCTQGRATLRISPHAVQTILRFWGEFKSCRCWRRIGDFGDEQHVPVVDGGTRPDVRGTGDPFLEKLRAMCESYLFAFNREGDFNLEANLEHLLLSKERKTSKVLRNSTSKSRPDSGRACLACAEFTGQRILICLLATGKEISVCLWQTAILI